MVKSRRSKDPIAQLRTKLSKAIQTLDLLKSEYDYDDLYHHFKNYKKTKDPSSKSLYSKYTKWNYIKKKIVKLQRELSTKYNIQVEENNNEQSSEVDPPLIKCDNCCRRPISICTSAYELNLSVISSSDVIESRTFCNLKGTRSRDSVEYNVCVQCKTHLTLVDTEEASKEKNTWLAFVWKILSSDDTINTYGGAFIWKFIPTQ